MSIRHDFLSVSNAATHQKAVYQLRRNILSAMSVMSPVMGFYSIWQEALLSQRGRAILYVCQYS